MVVPVDVLGDRDLQFADTGPLLRQYFPKGTDLSGYTQSELDAVVDELNDRLRETLDGRKPPEVLNKLLTEAGGVPTA